MSYLDKSYETTITEELLEDPPVQIRIGYTTFEEAADIAAFSVQLQYWINNQWFPVSEIPHESRIGYPGLNVKQRGMKLYVYKDKKRFKKRDPVESHQLQDKTVSGCLDVAQTVTYRWLAELIANFEDMHGLQ